MDQATSSDPVIGRLTFSDYYWQRKESIQLFGHTYTVSAIFEGELDTPLDSAQQEAYAAFLRDREACLDRVQQAVYGYYTSVLPELRRRLGESADALAPLILSSESLAAIVTPTHISFPLTVQAPDRVVGLLLDCAWDPGRGLGVKIVNEHVQEVGIQDVVL